MANPDCSWDRIPTDPGPSKLRDRAMIDTHVCSFGPFFVGRVGQISWKNPSVELGGGIETSWSPGGLFDNDGIDLTSK